MHVNDPCSANLLALAHLEHHSRFHAVNLGNGNSFSVREVAPALETVTKLRCGRGLLAATMGTQRDPQRARPSVREMDWRLAFRDLHAIVKLA